MSEASDERSEDYSEALRVKRTLSELIDSEGWLFLEKELKEQIDSLRTQSLQAAGSMDRLISKEHSLGVVYGLLSAIELPRQLVDGAEALIQLELEQQKADEEAEAEAQRIREEFGDLSEEEEEE